MTVRVISAFTLDGVMSVNGRMPFQSKDYHEMLRKLTRNKAVVIGRKTFESIDQDSFLTRCVPLVLSKSGSAQLSHYRSIDELLSDNPGQDIDVIGGAEIVRQFLEADLVDELILTHILTTVSEGVLTEFPTHLSTKFSPVELLLSRKPSKKNQFGLTMVRHVHNQKQGTQQIWQA